MFTIGVSERITITVVALIIFGPQLLSQVAGQIGKVIRDFRRISDA